MPVGAARYPASIRSISLGKRARPMKAIHSARQDQYTRKRDHVDGIPIVNKGRTQGTEFPRDEKSHPKVALAYPVERVI